MLVSYIYLSSENLADTAIINNISTVSHLFCSRDRLALLCGNVEEIPSLIKKASRKSRLVVLSPGIMANYRENLNDLCKKMSLETFTADDDGISAFAATYKNSYISVLNENCNEIISYLLCKFKYKGTTNLTYDFVNINEIGIEAVKQTLAEQCPFSNPQLIAEEYYDYVRIHIIALHDRFEYCSELCSDTKRNLQMLFGDNCFTDDIYKTVVDLLIEKNLKVATAESCTAGMISSAITSISNSSKVFEIGIASYSDRIKRDALGVNQSTINMYGAVSMETACEMAKGIKNLSDADIGIAVTGVAGPNTSENKPVGTVYIAMTNGQRNWVIKPELSETLPRNIIREKITYAVFDLLRRYLEFLPEILPDGTSVNAPCFLLYNQPHYNDGFINTLSLTKEQNNADLPLFDDIYSENEFNAESGKESEQISNDAVEQGFKVNIPKKILLNRFLMKASYFLSDIFKSMSGFAKFSTALIFTLIAALILSGSVYAYTYFKDEKDNNQVINDLRNSWSYSPSITTESKLSCFKPLNKINNDIDGWILIDNTEINLPICKTTDNDFYKSHNYYKDSSRFGSLYFDKNTVIERDKQSQNLVVYGNNTLNGSMFGELKNYKSYKYLTNNYKINLCTEYTSKDFLVFAAMIVTDDPKLNGNNFAFNKQAFSDTNEFNEWILQVKTRSLYKSSAAISENAQILTLVTDSTEFKGAKLVVMAFYDEGDDFFKIANNDTYSGTLSVNRSPQYPQKWYDKHDILNPYAYKDTVSNTSSDSDTSSNIIVIRPVDPTGSEVSSGEEDSSNVSSDITDSSSSSSSSTTTGSETDTPTSSGSSSSGNSNPTESTDSSNNDTSSDSSSSESNSSAESDNSSSNTSGDASSNTPAA